MFDVFICYKSERLPRRRSIWLIVLECHGYSEWFDNAKAAGDDFGVPITSARGSIRSPRRPIVQGVNYYDLGRR